MSWTKFSGNEARLHGIIKQSVNVTLSITMTETDLSAGVEVDLSKVTATFTIDEETQIFKPENFYLYADTGWTVYKAGENRYILYVDWYKSPRALFLTDGTFVVQHPIENAANFDPILGVLKDGAYFQRIGAEFIHEDIPEPLESNFSIPYGVVPEKLKAPTYIHPLFYINGFYYYHQEYPYV